MLILPDLGLYVPYNNQPANSGLSPAVWSGMKGSAMSPDGYGRCLGCLDDFDYVGNATAGTGVLGPNAYFLDTGATLTSVVTEIGGVLRAYVAATNSESAIVSRGGSATTVSLGAGQVKIAVGVPGTLTGLGTKVAFEARVRFTQVTDTYNFFVGLVEQARAINNGNMSDAGAVGAVDCLGFNVTMDDGNSLNFGYSVGSGSPADVATYGAIEAATWYKLGFVYDPAAVTAQRITYFVDGVPQTDYVTGTVIAASTFPGGEEMAPYLEIKAHSTASGTPSVDIDWWACGQIAP